MKDEWSYRNTAEVMLALGDSVTYTLLRLIIYYKTRFQVPGFSLTVWR